MSFSSLQQQAVVRSFQQNSESLPIPVKPDDILQVSFIGYKTEIVPIKGKTKINVTLNPTAENLEEVAVVAFGTQKKKALSQLSLRCVPWT